MTLSLTSLPGLEQVDSELADILNLGRVTRVVVDTRNRSWRLELLFTGLLGLAKIEKLEQALASLTPGPVLLELLVNYELSGMVEPGEIIPLCRDELSRELKQMIPSINGWINHCDWQWTGTSLNLTVADENILSLMQAKNFTGIFARLIKRKFGWSVPVQLNCRPAHQPTGQNWQQEAEAALIQELADRQASLSTANGAKARETAVPEGNVYIGKPIKGEGVPIKEVQDEERQVIIRGRIFEVTVRVLRSGRQLLTFNITDMTDSIGVKLFLEESQEEAATRIKDGLWVIIRGPAQYDKFSQELTVMANDINAYVPLKRQDTAPEKRVELHLHTRMSAMDAVCTAAEVVKRAKEWGHSAVAVTDHGVVQSFPEAHDAAKKHGIKVIYGLEGYLIDDGQPIVQNPVEQSLDSLEYVVFDLETTGFHPQTDEIIEIGAVKLVNGSITGRFSTLVKPSGPIPAEIQKLTGINDDMVADAADTIEAVTGFCDFAGGAVLVAHNAGFDCSFMAANYQRYLGIALENPVVDTLALARALYPQLKNHKLNTLVKEFGVALENHHRAVDDAAATAELFKKFWQKVKSLEINSLTQVNQLGKGINHEKLKSNHITILVKNATGLKNLYQLVTYAHLKYYHRHPRIPRSLLTAYREGLLVGSACEAGEFFRAILAGVPEKRLEEIGSYYDYLEIQPRANNEFLLRTGQARNEADLLAYNRTVVRLGEKLNIPVVATGDVHFLEPEDEVYRRILMAGQGFEDADNQAPLYYKTTDEMLTEFAYLGQAKAREVVIVNPQAIADQVEVIKPIPDELYPPHIDGAEEQITDMSKAKAAELYGQPLPEIVQKRLDRELNSICGHGFAVLYLIAQKLVKKSNDDGYLVGSRGSVGSSFVATMSNITEVNPLPPHYRCGQCKYSEFIDDGSYGSGADLPDKQCPHCGIPMIKDGHEIPFEVFLGFEGDKVPDIDLNFSGDYQPRAHKFTEELFGKDNVFRAGTIGTIAEKTAYGFVKNYMEDKGLKVRSAEISRLVHGCTGVKRTTGQHPGGVMVVPKTVDVHMFTPLQHPADDKKSGIITTHFDYHSISSRLVKLDILGHDDPTVIRMLEDLTGFNPRTIPLDEPKVMALFTGTGSLGVTPEQIRSTVGTYAIPEFGTKFVRQMLVDTKPQTFSELVRISGFSHGTDVWLNNAQDLIRNGTCKLSEAISARDDIMMYLLHKGLKPKLAFKIMESVRKGKGVKEEDAAEMQAHNVPEWYLESCRKIKYMFPKAHAVAYVMMAFRIAYFKVYYPEAFYCAYFTVRADDFDAALMVQGIEKIKSTIEEIEAKGNGASQKEKGLLTILEVALEMTARGIRLLPVNLNQSEANRFMIQPAGLLPPFTGLQGVGEAAALNIVAARQEATFTSIEDLRVRAKLSKTVIEILQDHGCLQGMDESDQLSLF